MTRLAYSSGWITMIHQRENSWNKAGEGPGRLHHSNDITTGNMQWPSKFTWVHWVKKVRKGFESSWLLGLGPLAGNAMPSFSKDVSETWNGRIEWIQTMFSMHQASNITGIARYSSELSGFDGWEPSETQPNPATIFDHLWKCLVTFFGGYAKYPKTRGYSLWFSLSSQDSSQQQLMILLFKLIYNDIQWYTMIYIYIYWYAKSIYVYVLNKKKTDIT